MPPTRSLGIHALLRSPVPLTCLALLLTAGCRTETTERPPNILFVINDDQSWPHASAYGSRFVTTPGFDQVARDGVLFTRAFVTSPGCAPSRASIVLGRYPWQNGPAGNHSSLFPGDLETLTDLLEQAGYAVGMTGKGVGPFQWALGGRTRDPAGVEVDEARLDPPTSGINRIDYAENFRIFLDERPEDAPFFFWFGATEPHRAYEVGSGLRDGKRLQDVEVPGFLPDLDSVRVDLLDYALEIEWADAHLRRMLRLLEETGEAANTLVIVTADNGMPFPAAKANTYEYGIHVPLAASWGGRIPAGRTVDDLVSLVDLFPTFLEAARIPLPPASAIDGRSLLPVLRSTRSGTLDPERNAVFASRERHSSSRWENLGYPQRAIRTSRYLYIRNFAPERWPAGAPYRIEGDGRLVPGFHDIDWGPRTGLTARVMFRSAEAEEIKPFVDHATALRPAEELFDIEADPFCRRNLAADPAFERTRADLAARLEKKLRETGDPRLVGTDPDIFETYPRFAGIRRFPRPAWTDTMDSAALQRLVGRVGSNLDAMVRPDSIWSDGLRFGPWLLERKDESWALFDLEKDPGAIRDLSDRMPRVVDQLERLYLETSPGTAP